MDKENESLEYRLAETAFVLFWQDMLYRYEARIKYNLGESEDAPSFGELYSEDYAKGIFHDYAYMMAIIEDIVKGRRFE